MIRKNLTEAVDKYLSGELTGDALSEFNRALALNPELAEEIKLQQEIQDAMTETDIIELRDNLQNMITKQKNTDHEMETGFNGQTFSFELSEERSTFKEFNQPVNINDIISFSQSLPKIHLVQHHIASKENIHQFYKEQQSQDPLYMNEYILEPGDETIFEDVQAALAERDIQDLRANLQQIAASVPAHQRTSQEIEQYNSNELTGKHLADFEQELLVNNDLVKDVELFKNIDLAVAQTDIMELRASLQSIRQTEASTAQKVKEIDKYLNDELTGNDLTAFETELSNNPGLESELELFTEIDKAVSETGIMELREKLNRISREISREEKQKRSFVAKISSSRTTIAAVAASLVLLLSIAGIINRHHASSGASLYSQYYRSYETTGIFRSGDALVDNKLTQALHKFNAEEYQSAIVLFNEVLQIDKNNPVSNFYSGMAYQETGQTDMALGAYHKVLKDRDNLFTEQANWYIGLCYLRIENRKKAYRQFKKIANSESFYQEKALAILRKIGDLE